MRRAPPAHPPTHTHTARMPILIVHRVQGQVINIRTAPRSFGSLCRIAHSDFSVGIAHTILHSSGTALCRTLSRIADLSVGPRLSDRSSRILSRIAHTLACISVGLHRGSLSRTALSILLSEHLDRFLGPLSSFIVISLNPHTLIHIYICKAYMFGGASRVGST